MSEDKFNFMKTKNSRNKNLVTMIDKTRYKLNNANRLVNKIAEKNIGKNNAIKAYNNLVDTTEQISKFRSTEPR